MNIVSHLPHDVTTKLHAVCTYRNNNCSVNFVCRKYHISKASLMRWNHLYNGNKESLIAKSHRPLTPHPNSHTLDEIQKIKALIKRNPHIGLTELYTKLRHQIAYSRHYTSLYRVLVRIGYYLNKAAVRKPYKPKIYHTPECLGEKWQLDVKYVPRDCNANLTDDHHYFQYTIIDEASRERFIYSYQEQSSYSSNDFLYRSICYYGYVPGMIQTDNGFEFTYFKDTDLIHPFDVECQKLGIIHKTIKPRTPRHNGKVERSHRNDNERFYRYLKFYSFEDLQMQIKRYLYRSNRIAMTPLNYKTPIEMRASLIERNLVKYLACQISKKL